MVEFSTVPAETAGGRPGSRIAVSIDRRVADLIIWFENRGERRARWNSEGNAASGEVRDIWLSRWPPDSCTTCVSRRDLSFEPVRLRRRSTTLALEWSDYRPLLSCRSVVLRALPVDHLRAADSL